MRKRHRSGYQSAVLRIAARGQTLEILEARMMLSASALAGAPVSPDVIALAKSHFSQPTFQLQSSGGGIVPDSLTPVGLTPQQIRGAYGFGPYGSSLITFGATQGDGNGQTIAIVDAFDDPNAFSDLQTFDTQFGLPDPPSFSKIDETGGSSPLPSPAPVGTWGLEISLDIEWSHVIAPKANIVLVECNGASDFDLMVEGATTAAKQSGVSVVSMSFGGPEFASESTLDSLFTEPSGSPGVTFLASTGDSGSPGSYPAYAQTVVAVGGTSLTVGSGNSYGGETGWSGSGGGISFQEFQPTFQTPFFTSTQRTIPDVSFDANPFTGVAVYDSYDFPTSPWLPVGGTSLAAPLWAGTIAVVNQGRILNGKTNLDGPGQTLPLIYGLPSSDFNDPTSGSNGGFTAGSGYDLVTGRGTPIANLLVHALASATAPALLSDLQPVQPNGWSAPFVLSTSSGSRTDPAMILPSTDVFLNAAWFNDGAVSESTTFATDFRLNGVDLSAPSTVGGLALFPDAEAVQGADLGTYSSFATHVAEFKYNIDSTNAVTESTETNNTYTRTYVVDGTAADNYVLQIDPTGTSVQILLNNAVVYSAARGTVNAFAFYLSGSNDTLTINGANGNPLPFGGTISNASSTGNTLSVNETSGTNQISVDGSHVTVSGFPVAYSGLSTITVNGGTGNDTLTQLAQPAAALRFNGGGGNDTLSINAGAFTFPVSVSGIGVQSLFNLSISGGASVILPQAASANRTLLQLGTLSNSGKLDLSNNDMAVHSTPESTIFSELKTGFNTHVGYWNGASGIVSSAAAGDTRLLTTLGERPSAGGTFDGVSTSVNDTLVKYTCYGDADLSGTLNGADDHQADLGLGGGGTGWFKGDFNYDGITNGLDYALLDNATNQVAATGAAPLLEVAAVSVPNAADSSGLLSPNGASGDKLTDYADQVLALSDPLRGN